jgi:hypothetical protein
MTGEKSIKPRNRNYYKDLLTKKFLTEQYVFLHKSSKQIAKEFDLKSDMTLRRWLKKHNISIRGMSEAAILNDRSKANRKFYEEISGSYWYTIKFRADSRNIEFNITQKYVWDLYVAQNRKCILSGYNIGFAKNGGRKARYEQAASLDRINSTMGYIEGNVQWIHKDLQSVKMCLTNEQMIQFCKDIYLHNFGKIA